MLTEVQLTRRKKISSIRPVNEEQLLPAEMRFENQADQILSNEPHGIDLIDQQRNRSDSFQSASSEHPLGNDDMYHNDRDNPFPPEVRQQHSQELTSHLPLRIAIRD